MKIMDGMNSVTGSSYTENIGKMFNFNDADWNNIARYETEVDKLTLRKTVRRL